ncbi:MAG: sortase [Clostridiales bacterium]|nr:sortase [Clostridiales bacterium]
MKRNVSSHKKSKSSNIVLKIGVTYIIPIFLAIVGAMMLCYFAWNAIFSRYSFYGNIDNNSEGGMTRASSVINGKTIYRPTLNEKIGDITIDSVSINMGIYECNVDSSMVLGAAHVSISSLPGEGRRVALVTYPSKGFNKLENIKNNDKVVIQTSYGKYTYSVSDSKVINDKISDCTNYFTESDELILFTSYPFDEIGSSSKYYMVTCEFVSVE